MISLSGSAAATFRGGGKPAPKSLAICHSFQDIQQGGSRMSRKLMLLVALCAVLALVGCGGGTKEEPAAPAAAPAAPAANAGGVTGTVTFAGTDTDTPIAFSADPICDSLHKNAPA